MNEANKEMEEPYGEAVHTLGNQNDVIGDWRKAVTSMLGQFAAHTTITMDPVPQQVTLLYHRWQSGKAINHQLIWLR